MRRPRSRRRKDTVTTRPIEQLNVALSAGAVAGAAVLVTPHFAMSVAVGALLEVLNFRGLAIASGALFRGALQGSAAWLLLLALRLGLVGAALYGAIRFGGVDPVGVLIGLSVVLPASLIGAWRLRPPVDLNAQPLEDPAVGPSSRSAGEPDDWGWDALLYADPTGRSETDLPAGAAARSTTHRDES